MKVDVAIIGAGVSGCAAARELSRFALSCVVLEREEDVCCGTSKANSAIIHAGFDAAPGTLMAKYNVLGSERMEALCRELDIPYKRCGALVIAPDESGRAGLEKLLRQGEENGVKGLRIVESAELHAMESALAAELPAALYAPTSAVICPFELCAAMAESAARNGAEFLFDHAVTALVRTEGGWRITAGGETIEARAVVNAAGVYADVLHNMVSEEKLEIVPRRGEYCLLDRKTGSLVSRTIFQLPTGMGKGVLVSPTVHGNTIVGPTANDIDDREDTATTAEQLDYLMRCARLGVPSLPGNKTITSFSGLRAHVRDDKHDFRLGFAAEGFYELLGIESPGLSSAPALGEEAAARIAEYLGAEKKTDWLPGRERVVRPNEMTIEERSALVREHPEYGRIICRCETVSEGEILDAIRRKPGARSLDGVKRRTRSGMGRCQGGFCAPRVMELLSRELGVPQTELTKNGRGRMLVGLSREEEA